MGGLGRQGSICLLVFVCYTQKMGGAMDEDGYVQDGGGGIAIGIFS